MPTTATLRTVSKSPRTWLVLAAGLPLLLSAIMQAVGQSPSPVPAAPKRPSLVFEQYLVNLGKAHPSPVVYGRFAFTNRGTETLHVTEIEPSCKCLRPELKKRDYAPGEEGEFHVQVNTPNEEPGPKDYTVTLHYTDPEPRSVTVTFKVELPDNQIVIRPPLLVFHQTGGTEDTKEAVIVDYSRRNFELKEIELSKKLGGIARVQVGEIEHDADGSRKIHLQVTASANVPSGRHQGIARIHTGDDVYEWIMVPIVVDGPIDPKKARAPMVLSPLAPEGASGKRVVPAEALDSSDSDPPPFENGPAPASAR